MLGESSASEQTQPCKQCEQTSKQCEQPINSVNNRPVLLTSAVKILSGAVISRVDSSERNLIHILLPRVVSTYDTPSV